MSCCERCDTVGDPPEDTLQYAVLNLHRACHELLGVLVGPLARWLVALIPQRCQVCGCPEGPGIPAGWRGQVCGTCTYEREGEA